MLVNQAEQFVQQLISNLNRNKLKNNASYLVLCMWQIMLAGAFLINFVNNYCMFYAFKTLNVFIYSNLLMSTVFLTIVFINSCINRFNTNQANHSRYDEAESTRNLKLSERFEDEEFEMIEKEELDDGLKMSQIFERN
jgi:hypothetical protein